MRLLTPFEFIEMFPEGKSLIFVGNAPSLKGERLGEWIDSHDVVVRFNACPLKEYAEDVGTRTGILVTNPYPEERPKLSLTGVSPRAVLVITPQTRRGNYREFEVWAEDLSILFTYTPDLVGVEGADHKAGLTTGAYSLQLLPRLLKPCSVSITGFTMFMKTSACHYWSSVTPSGLRAHDMEVESKLFINLSNRLHCPVVVTEEIAWVSRRIGMNLRKKDLIVRRLRNQEWSL